MQLDDRIWFTPPVLGLDPARLAVVTAPSVEPWLATDDEVEQALRLDSDDDTAFVTQVLKAARIHFERVIGLALLQQTLRVEFDRAPLAAGVEIPVAPLRAVSSLTVNGITYLDAAGATQTLNPSNYVQPRAGIPRSYARLRLAPDGGWPNLGDYPAAFRVEVNAGFGALATDVPADIRLAVLWLAAWWYEARLPVNIGNITSELPHHLNALIEAHRVAFIG